MKDSVLDILIHLFENFLDAEDDSTPDRDALEAASSNRRVTRKPTSSARSSGSRASPPTRIARSAKARRGRCACSAARSRSGSTPTCAATCCTSRTWASCPRPQREVVIDRLLALEADDIDIEQLKWVVLMVLFSQPGQENAYQRMEDLVFDERRDAMH